MERIESVNPERIEWCLTERGVTLDQLAKDLSIAESSLQKVIERKQGLSYAQLKRLSKYFSRGVLFFLEPGPVDEESVHSPAFRTLANQKPTLSPRVKALIERAERQRELYVSLREDLDNEDWITFEPPHMPQDPAQAAAAARKWLGLGDQSNFAEYRASVEARGVLVFRSNGYNGPWQIPRDSPILGFSIYDEICPLIVVRKQTSESRQVFTLMHELGHLLLHRQSFIDDVQDLLEVGGYERVANAFAGYLLVPDDLLATIDDTTRPTHVSEFDHWLLEKRRAWGVSSEVLLRRLMDVGRLPHNLYAEYRQWWENTAASTPETRGTRRYRFREPKHMFGDTFVRTVLDALNARHITLAKASTYLDRLKIKDVHRLERDYAGL